MSDNPKMVQAQKEGKTPFHTIPLTSLYALARVMATGAFKYGRFNFLIDAIRASTYIGAIMRHTFEWATGGDRDKESGEHPLAHVMACCAVVIAAEDRGMLIDDRLECESKDPDTGEVRVENLITDELDAKIEDVMAPFRRYAELSRRIVAAHLSMPTGAQPLTGDEWEELEGLYLMLPPGLLSRHADNQRSADDVGNGD